MEVSDQSISDCGEVEEGGDLFQEAYIYLTEHRYPSGCVDSRKRRIRKKASLIPQTIYMRQLGSKVTRLEEGCCARRRSVFQKEEERQVTNIALVRNRSSIRRGKARCLNYDTSRYIQK